MFLDRLSAELEKVAARYRRLWGWQSLATALLVGALTGLAVRWFSLSAILHSRTVTALASAATAVIIAQVILRSRSLSVDQHWIARQIEDKYPDLDSCLLAAVEQNPSLADGRYGFLQASVIQQALIHSAQNNWRSVVSRGRMARAITVNVATFALLLSVVGYGPRAIPQTAKIAKDGKKPHVATGEFSVTVEPGNTELERGTSLLVLARVQGQMPADALLMAHPSGSEPQRIAMSASLDDPIFGGRVPSVSEPFEYHVELGGYVSPTYQVTVFEYPRLERADAKLVYPGYTGLETRLIQDIRTISVVEGTQVTLICRLNKAVKSARFLENVLQKKPAKQPVPRDSDAPTPMPPDDPATGKPVGDQRANDKPAEVELPDLVLSPRNPSSPIPPAAVAVAPVETVPVIAAPASPPAEHEAYIYETTFIAGKTRRLKLELIDDAGRQNAEQVNIVVQVVPNQPPTLKLVAPGHDLEVSPLEELDLKATAWDDFGVKRMGVSFGLAGESPKDVVLGEDAAARQRHELNDQIRLEDLQAEPDQLLAYYFWAEDFDAEGQLRRTSSDMYFAEVRHFDEIFRQGQQPPGGEQQQRQQQQQQQGQNAQQAQQLAQLQKDIINATWKLIRRETGAKPTGPFVEDVDQISQSQNSALEQADALGESIQDTESQGHLLAVLEAMQNAVRELKSAHDQPASVPLRPALAAEQSAYQALLKLRAREHEVVRQQQQQQSSSSSSQAARSAQQRQQMQQLDLKDEENRYETQRLAQSQNENPEERETRQVLNRLKELARRQHDLNERLKDLQSALQEAETERKKEEIRQQLKRLQEEQRDVLRDTDELQTRMETPENQERMAEERQQLEQARDQVQRAAEALEQDKVTQAAASGTRAEREFEDLRNEFRSRASGHFNEEMREMREAARELDQQEKKLSQQLAETTQPDPAKKSLRDETNTEDIAKGLSQQQTKLSTLNERLKQTIQDAEQTEPLLSERLNDTARNLIDQKVERALEATEQSVRRGFLDDAQQVEQIAGRGISQLKAGIEKAAESVLGDEAEALRRAREQLKQLNRELNQEIARNAPNEVPQPAPAREAADPAGNSPEGQPRASEQVRDPNGTQPRTAGQQPGRQQPGERQPGERQPGERQPGEGQPGEGQPGEQESPEPQPGQPSGQQQPPEGQSPGGRQPGRNGRQPPPSDRTPGQGQPRPGDQQPQESPESGARQDSQTDEPPTPEGQGQRQGQGQRPNAGQPRPGQPQQGQQPGQPGQPGAGQNPQRGQPGAQRGGSRGSRLDTDPNSGVGGGAFEQTDEPLTAPISGRDFLDWSDRLRDVEEMVDDPELRAEAARIRDAARAIRAEMKRHSAEPNWNLVRVNVAEPLAELANRVSDELLRRNSKQALVPLDRDPVPPKYSEKTRRYYEQLGSGK